MQSDERTYKVYQDDEQILEGIRFPGWLTLTDGRLSFVTAVRHFWQQAPKSALVTDGSV